MESIVMSHRHISTSSIGLVFSWFLTCIALPGCGPISPSAQKEIQDQQSSLTRIWVLHEMVQENDGVTVPQNVATLEFTRDQYHGTGGCNSCGGGYVLSANGKIKLGAGTWTEMACEDSRLMNFEMRFATVLGQVTSYKVSDTELQLSDGTDHNRLIFKPYQTPPPLDLQETRWSLELFEESDDLTVAATPVFSGSQITLSLKDGIAEGFGGVDPFQGTVEFSKGSLELNVTAASDSSASDELTEQQKKFLELLNSSTQFEVDTLHLRISNATGTQSLIFAPISAEEIQQKR